MHLIKVYHQNRRVIKNNRAMVVDELLQLLHRHKSSQNATAKHQ